jgi:hypothetical protein
MGPASTVLLLLLLIHVQHSYIFVEGSLLPPADLDAEHIVVAALPLQTDGDCVANCFSADGLAASAKPPWKLEPLTVVGNLTSANGTFAFLIPDGWGGLVQGGLFTKLDLPPPIFSASTSHHFSGGAPGFGGRFGAARDPDMWNATGLLVRWDAHRTPPNREKPHWSSMPGLVGVAATAAALDLGGEGSGSQAIVGGIFSESVGEQSKQLFNIASCTAIAPRRGGKPVGSCTPLFLDGSDEYVKGPQLNGFPTTLVYSRASRRLWGVYNDFSRTKGAFLNHIVGWEPGATTPKVMLRQVPPQTQSKTNVSTCCGFDLTADSSPFLDPWLIVDRLGNAAVVVSAGMEFDTPSPADWCPGSGPVRHPESSVVFLYDVSKKCWTATLQQGPQGLHSCLRKGDVNPIDPSHLVSIGTRCRDYGQTTLSHSALTDGSWTSRRIDLPRPFSYEHISAWGVAQFPGHWFVLGTSAGELFVRNASSLSSDRWRTVCSSTIQVECSKLLSASSADGEVGGQLVATWTQPDGGELVLNPKSPESGAMRVSWRKTGIPVPVPLLAHRENVTARPNIVDFWGTGRSLAVLTTAQDLFTNRSCLVWQPSSGTSEPWYVVDAVAFVTVNEANMYIGYADGDDVRVKKFGLGVSIRQGEVVGPSLPCYGPNSGSFGGAADASGTLYVVCSSYNPTLSWTLYTHGRGDTNWTSLKTGPGACRGDGWVVFVPSEFGKGFLVFMCTHFEIAGGTTEGMVGANRTGNILMPFNLSESEDHLSMPVISTDLNRTLFGLTYIASTRHAESLM